MFDLPYKINSSAIDFQDYSNNGLRDNEDITNYMYDNLSFEIYSTNSVDEKLGLLNLTLMEIILKIKLNLYH